MIRYTTPSIILRVPVDITDADKVVATFAQWNVRVDKEIGASSMSLQNGKTVIEVDLTQNETAKFSPDRPMIVQVNFKKSGKRMATVPKEIKRPFINVLDEVMK